MRTFLALLGELIMCVIALIIVSMCVNAPEPQSDGDAILDIPAPNYREFRHVATDAEYENGEFFR